MTAREKPLRVLVVDDSAYNRKMIRSMLQDMEEIGAVDAVSDGEEAIKAVMTDPPDVITLDLNMPRMDGFTFLRWLMRNRPLPVLVVSAEGGEKNVFKALDLGALDFVVKPVRYASERIVEIQSELQAKVRAVARKDMKDYLKRLKSSGEPGTARYRIPARRSETEVEGVLVIGASTGGPSAIQRVLSSLPDEFALPILVVQHMPPVFTNQFSIRLGKNTPFESKEAEDGDRLEPGLVLVAPGGFHMVMTSSAENTVLVEPKAEQDRFVPSIDRTMASAAERFGSGTIGVLLTGMGNDGAEGLGWIRRAGGRTVAESEETAVVFGMPRAAVAKGAAEVVAALDRIPARIIEMAAEISALKNGRSDASN